MAVKAYGRNCRGHSKLDSGALGCEEWASSEKSEKRCTDGCAKLGLRLSACEEDRTQGSMPWY